MGFEFGRQAAGSHEIWVNPFTGRYTTIPNHPGDVPEGTLHAVLSRAESTLKTSSRIEALTRFRVIQALVPRLRDNWQQETRQIHRSIRRTPASDATKAVAARPMNNPDSTTPTIIDKARSVAAGSSNPSNLQSNTMFPLSVRYTSP